ncbi:non-specific lipid transfer protein GPI-anchored 20-like [Gastrolobium bilobum]|uniref:non-specific lipid transfer protein GPI-anchored 20-like n=1 Tax=Gastrolobium bilobum TaxID=150636 RepID=UPI002AB02122|nr:non-specific lipid transfer protein GPI-anchored 20-like [Gastrolobium bilobum]
MASFVHLCRIALVLGMAMVMAAPAYAQISTPCNASTLSTLFTPCMSFFTNSSANGASPTTECCSALKSLTSGGMNCFCLIFTASVPFRIPINRTLAISLPRACNMPGVPFQCKASGSPIPAPGPVSLGPSPSPVSSPSASSGFTPTPSPQAASSVFPSPTSPSLAPMSDTTPPLLTPTSPPVDSDTPSASTGRGRSNLTPSSAISSYSVPPSVLLIALGFAVLKYY